MKKNKRYAGILIKCDDKVLLCKRSLKKARGGEWSIPSGGIEENEEPIDAAYREFFEETGIEITKKIDLISMIAKMGKKQKGSNNRAKAKLKLTKAHEKIKNQKQDYLHNITTKIVNENQVIILEDLNVSGMMKNHKLAKVIQQLGLYELRRQLEYKSNWYGRELLFVDRFYPSSKKCSCCGNIKKDLTLKDREYICEVCGLVMDRDMNASLNIESEGLRLYSKKIGQRLSEYTLEDLPLMDDRQQ